MLKLEKNQVVAADSSSDDLLQRFQNEYLEHRDFVRTTIYWMLRTDEVDDLVQDTFVKAWHSYKNFKANSSFKTWIYRIAKNVTLDYLKKNKPLYQKHEDPTSAPSDHATKDLITKGLLNLNLKQREVFILYYKLDYSIADIAQLVKLSPGTVKSRLFHARKIFELYLEENGVRYE